MQKKTQINFSHKMEVRRDQFNDVNLQKDKLMHIQTKHQRVHVRAQASISNAAQLSPTRCLKSSTFMILQCNFNHMVTSSAVKRCSDCQSSATAAQEILDTSHFKCERTLSSWVPLFLPCKCAQKC